MHYQYVVSMCKVLMIEKETDTLIYELPDVKGQTMVYRTSSERKKNKRELNLALRNIHSIPVLMEEIEVTTLNLSHNFIHCI